ncbi:barstar family protein [Eubacterium aggregans]|uniref:barstar family protein n=1 Tax=Eubacterium aggregans TaxID=81409 RepID=UPI003F2C81BA
MIDVRLEGDKMITPEKAQSHIKKRMDFEDNYGATPDALWDALNDIEEPTAITLYDTQAMLNNLGQYGYDLLDTFQDAGRSTETCCLKKIKASNVRRLSYADYCYQ